VAAGGAFGKVAEGGPQVRAAAPEPAGQGGRSCAVQPAMVAGFGGGQQMALKHLLAGVAALGLLAPPALAQTQGTEQQQQPPAQAGEQQQLAQVDMEFATKAAEGGLKEVRLGELAQQQAASEEVRQFGQRMVEDHGAANDQLMQIAQDKGIDLPQELSAEAQQLHDELAQKQGEEFDQAYMDEMVSDHQKDVEEFQQYVEEGQDPELTSFAEQTVPVLQEHLELAQQTQEQVVAGGVAGEQPDAAMQDQQPAMQDQQQGAMQEQQPAMQDQQQAATQPQQPVSIEEVLGSSVVNADGEEVAEIEDIVVDQDQTHYAILSVGGFLGIGDKKVAIPLDQLQLGEDETYLMSGETEEQLEAMPEYEEGQYQPLQQRG
jgi:putative membrane protein